jgi:hypothetical protein
MGKKADGPKETPQQKALAEVARARFADYRKRWAPLQRQLAADIKDAGKADSFERRQAAGKSATDSAVRFGEAKGVVESRLADTSGSIGSSRSKVGIAGMGDDEATSRGLGFVAADQAIDDAYTQGLGMIAAMGQGEAAGAMEGMGDIAARSGARAAQDAQLAAQRRAGNAQLVGQVAGFGLAGGFNGMFPGGGASSTTVGTMANNGHPSTVGMSY